MLSESAHFKKKKQYQDDNSSVSTLNATETTKKAMSTQEIILEPTHVRSSMHGKASMHTYSLHLPASLSIPRIVTILKEKLGTYVIYSDCDRGQLLIQSPKKSSLWDIIDCLLFWRIQGSTKGTLSQSYSVISIRITKQVIQQRCTITVKPSHPKSKDKFYLEVIHLIQTQIKSIPLTNKIQEKIKSIGLDHDSPLNKQINSYKNIQKLYSSTDKRYKILIQKAIEKIKENIQFSIQQKAKKGRISLVESIVNQANSLMVSFTYDQPQNSNYHVEYTLYAIQSMLCHGILLKTISFYKQQTKDQSKIFNQQCQLINSNFSNHQCWQYLECRSKYTLPSQSQPYYLSILALRQISCANTLREMLLCVQRCFSELKVCCLVEHKGSLQLATMDDILPVMVYIVARAAIVDFPAYVKMVDDYIQSRGTFELEERVITTLYVAVEDITKKWAMKNKNDK